MTPKITWARGKGMRKTERLGTDYDLSKRRALVSIFCIYPTKRKVLFKRVISLIEVCKSKIMCNNNLSIGIYSIPLLYYCFSLSKHHYMHLLFNILCNILMSVSYKCSYIGLKKKGIILVSFLVFKVGVHLNIFNLLEWYYFGREKHNHRYV